MLQREEGKFAMCVNCGNKSCDYDICDSCHKPLPDNVKFYIPGPSNASKKARMDDGLLDLPSCVTPSGPVSAASRRS